MKRKSPSALLIFCLLTIVSTGQNKNGKPRVETNEAKIARALSAAPPDVAKAAKVVEQSENENQITLREGSNGFTCFAGHPGEVGGQPFCRRCASPAMGKRPGTTQTKTY